MRLYTVRVGDWIWFDVVTFMLRSESSSGRTRLDIRVAESWNRWRYEHVYLDEQADERIWIWPQDSVFQDKGT